MKDLDMVIQLARLLLVLNEQDANVDKVAAISNQVCKVKELREEVVKLTEQVAALSTNSQSGAARFQQQPRRCFNCNRISHLQRDCPFCCQEVVFRKGYLCSQPVHIAWQCPGNDKGLSV